MSSRSDDETTGIEPLRPPLRPDAPEGQADATAPEAPRPEGVAFSTRTTGPGKLRIGAVAGAAVALAVGAAATSFAASPPPPQSNATAAVLITPAAIAGDPLVDGIDQGFDHGRFGERRGIGGITVAAIDGSNLTLTTDDGWTRTIAVTDAVDITKGGQDIDLSGVAVGDAVRFAQTRNDDGTYTVTAIAIVVPSVTGTVGEVTANGFTVKTRDGSTWTITTNGSTVYRYGPAEGTSSDVTAGGLVRVQGTQNGDNALTATSVTVAGDRVAGTVTAKTDSTITVETRDGTSKTIHIDADTTYRVEGDDSGALADIAVGDVIVAAGRARDDGSLDASIVGEGRGRGGPERGLRGGPGRDFFGGPGGWRGDKDAEPEASPTPTPAP